MRRITGGLLIIAVASLVVLLPTWRRNVLVVQAATSCTDATLNGNYAVTWSGFENPDGKAGGHESPWAGIGTAPFDGGGNVSLNFSTARNGKIFTDQKTSGKYSINSDCTGSLVFTSGAAKGLTANLVIIGGGKEVFSMSTTTSDTVTFDLKKR